MVWNAEFQDRSGVASVASLSIILEVFNGSSFFFATLIWSYLHVLSS